MIRVSYNKRLMYMIIFMLPVFLIAQQGTTSMNGKLMQKTPERSLGSELMLPMNVAVDTAWLHYDDVENYDAWGFLISGEEYDVVAKWDAAQISNYDEWSITKVKFIVVNNSPYIKVKVFEGPGYTEIYSQDVPTYNINTWTEVELDTPVIIDGSQELYVGYYVDMTHTELGGFVTATDDGPAIDDYGNLVRWNGAWYSDFNNHNLRVFVEAELTADFEADNTVICSGGTVNFTNLSLAEESYNWTFEGGTPSSSTEENPTVTYNTPGIYDVTLEVSNNGDTDTETKVDYISVLDIPGIADTPQGESNVCTDQFYDFTTNPVLYAQSYEWEIDPTDAGILSPNDTLVTLQVADDWTGDFILKVRATNMCGDGDWSDDLEGTVYESPEVYILEGGGGYCLDGDGVEITLDGSDIGVNYELYLNDVPTGNIIAGTGSPISFGMITEEGYYIAHASNDNCAIPMLNQIEVFIMFPPLEPDTPTGPEVVCDEATSDYESTGTGDTNSYEWELSPEEAGNIVGNNLEATVTWNAEFTGIAMVSLYGINECGDGNSSQALEVSVGAPKPEITGESMVCDWSDEVYEVVENEGSNYTWEVTGGSISDGQGTYLVTVSWEGEGTGTISVSEETADGCEGASEQYDVTIDDCTGLKEWSLRNNLSINPNPVHGNNITIYTGTEEEVTIQIYGIDGKLKLQQTLNNNSVVVDISEFLSGIYFLKAISVDQQVLVVKFIKN